MPGTQAAFTSPGETQVTQEALASPFAPQATEDHLRLSDGGFSLRRLLALPDLIDLEVITVAQPFVNPIGGRVPSGAWMQQTTLSASFGSGLAKPASSWREIDHWTVDLELALLNGNPNYGAQIGAVYSPQSLFDPVGLWPSGFSLSRRPGAGGWGLDVGLLSLEPDFLTAPVYGYYVSSLLGSAPGLTIPSFPISPAATPGGVLTLKLSPDTSLNFGSFDLAATASVANSLGVSSGIPVGNGWLHLAQLSYEPAWLTAATADPIPACRKHNRLSRRNQSCRDRVRVERQLPAGQILLAGFSGQGPNRAAYAHVTAPVSLPYGLDHRLWVAGLYGADPSRNPNPSFVGGGLLSQGVLPGRPFDVLVIGLARGGFSSALTPELSYEGVVELGYQIRLSQSFTLQPTWLWILRPGGDGKVPGIGAAGLQITWGF